ncbi:MAG: type I-E CRISPR-associated protein Cse2/CasB, partial [Propionibacteriaceae bacterium]
MSKSFRVGNLVDARITMIHSRQDAYSKQALANLRRGVGKPVGSVPTLWEYTHVATDEEYADMKAEIAVHLAMTQWAMHQQSKKQSMHN